MSKKKPASRGSTQLPGDLTYLHEKLGQAISSAMFTEDPQRLAEVFHSLSRGLHEVSENSPYLQSENAQQWAEKIRSLIRPSAEDLAAPGAKEHGGWAIRAGRMTRDEKYELATCIWELFNHVGNVGR